MAASTIRDPRFAPFLLIALVTGLGAQEGLRPERMPRALDEADLSERVTPVVKAVRRAADSVVSIYVQRRGVDGASGPMQGQGSGVILDPSGLVITNWHVVAVAIGNERSIGIQVRLKDGRRYAARVLSTSPEADLALLGLELGDGEEVQPAVLGDSDDLMPGETVIAIGNPQGHANTVTTGVLSATERTITVRAPDGRPREYRGLLQTDAAINQGNSGGALLDITGRLIGINNAMAVGVENIGFAIPVNTVKRVFEDQLLSAENLASVWLGMRVADADGVLAVRDLHPNGPAARAGLRPGDRIRAAAEEPVETPVEFARRLLAARAGKPFPLRVERGGRIVDAAPVPVPRAMAAVVKLAGLEVDEVTGRQAPDLVRQASLAYYAGHRRAFLLPLVIRVTRVHDGGPAAELGIRPDDLLLASVVRGPFGDVRWRPFDSVDDLAARLDAAAGHGLRLLVLRDGEDLEGVLDVR